MSEKGTGLLGFADYTSPIIRPGYNRAKTDKVVGKLRQNEQDYLERIRNLDEELKLVTRQRNATCKAYLIYLENHGVELDGDEFDRYFEECMNET